MTTQKHTAIATEIAQLEAERDQIDQKWRRLRHATVRTPEERHALNTKLASLEVPFREVEATLARLHVEAVERRLAGIDDVDGDALARAEAEFLAARAVYDELRHLSQAAHVRRRDGEQDLKIARRTLVEAEAALEHRRQRQTELESRPVRGPLLAAQWVGDHRH